MNFTQNDKRQNPDDHHIMNLWKPNSYFYGNRSRSLNWRQFCCIILSFLLAEFPEAWFIIIFCMTDFIEMVYCNFPAHTQAHLQPQSWRILQQLKNVSLIFFFCISASTPTDASSLVEEINMSCKYQYLHYY